MTLINSWINVLISKNDILQECLQAESGYYFPVSEICEYNQIQWIYWFVCVIYLLHLFFFFCNVGRQIKAHQAQPYPSHYIHLQCIYL